MRGCVRCGRVVEDFDIGGDGLCIQCESSIHGRGSGSAEDVPCQRCGMYIPYTELKMWNSRLYCNYCIMDIQDEEEMVRKAGRKEGKESEKILPELPSSGIGTCERCGKQAQQLYLFFGRKLCLQCYNSSSEQGQPPTSGPSLFGQIVRLLSSGFRDRRQPRIIAAQQIKEKPKEVFDIGLRRMVPQKSEIELAAPLIEEKKKDRIAKKKGAKSRLLSFLGFKRQ